MGNRTFGALRGRGPPPRRSRQRNSRLLFTRTAPAGMMGFPSAKLTCRRGVNAQNAINIMGDRSPKANQKKSTQKQARANSADQKKKQAVAALQAAVKKN